MYIKSRKVSFENCFNKIMKKKLFVICVKIYMYLSMKV